MEKRKDYLIGKYLKPSPKGTWTGRDSDPFQGPMYYHQKIIQISDLSQIGNGDIVLIGYACDEGVRRNNGRVGAFNGPFHVKNMLAKCALPQSSMHNIYDLGNIICENDSLEEVQELLSLLTSEVISKGAFPINIGGGHDIAFGTGMGFMDANQIIGVKKLGIINFDAHFDLRNGNIQGNSGTPFFQLYEKFEEHKIDFNYLVLGIQDEGNTKNLFDTAHQLSAQYIKDEDFKTFKISEIQLQIDMFISQVESIYISIDMDVISAAFAPAVSAANPLGCHPDLILNCLIPILKSGKVKTVDIAELNPTYDIDFITAKLAARIISKICSAKDN